VATFTQMGSGNWRVQVRRKTRYVAETFRRRKDGEEWALEMERNIDRNGSSKPRVARNVRTFGDLIDLHDEDMHEVGKPPRRSKAAVMASLKTALGSVKLAALNRERLIEFGRRRAKEGAGPATLAIRPLKRNGYFERFPHRLKAISIRLLIEWSLVRIQPGEPFKSIT
jgi:hypothetical protein